MNTPFFSIVVPTLNEERFITILLNSLFEQTEKDFEVLIVDGLSKDKTVNKVETFSSNFPLRLVRHKAQNVGAQRNHGAGLAQGKFLIFFDADVWVDAGFLANLKQKLQKGGIDFASPLVILDSHHLFDRIIELAINVFMILLARMHRPLMTGQAFIINRDGFLQIGGFDPTIVHAEDGELSMRAAGNNLRGTMISDLKVVVSARRFEREGRLKVLAKYVHANLYMAIKGPIRSHLFTYKMGGKP